MTHKAVLRITKPSKLGIGRRRTAYVTWSCKKHKKPYAYCNTCKRSIRLDTLKVDGVTRGCRDIFFFGDVALKVSDLARYNQNIVEFNVTSKLEAKYRKHFPYVVGYSKDKDKTFLVVERVKDLVLADQIKDSDELNVARKKMRDVVSAVGMDSTDMHGANYGVSGKRMMIVDSGYDYKEIRRREAEK